MAISSLDHGRAQLRAAGRLDARGGMETRDLGADGDEVGLDRLAAREADGQGRGLAARASAGGVALDECRSWR
jgi:hypothetical protein